VQRILQNSAYSGAKLAEKTQKNAEKETFARTEADAQRRDAHFIVHRRSC
jgi:hypothetical protein